VAAPAGIKDGAVTIVTAKSFDSVVSTGICSAALSFCVILTPFFLHSQVMDADRDVLLNVYSPRCGWCKKLTPIYHSLAEALVGVDSLTIAKVRQHTSDRTFQDASQGKEVFPPSAARIRWFDSLIV
jgi:thiol-disulfide isomerase/thioredoxin